MPDHDQTLRLYIERVSVLARERGRTLALDEMKQVAREIGISDDDLAAAEGVAAAHLERGHRFMEYGRWDDAVAELEGALVLNPGSLPVMHALAESYTERWQAAYAVSDRANAERCARECLAIDPNHTPSYELLNRLDTSPQAHAKVPADRERGRGRRIFLTLAAAVMLVVIVAAVMVNDDPLGAGCDYPAVPAVIPAPVPEPEAFRTGASDDGSTFAVLPVTWECERPELANVEVRAVRRMHDIALRFINTGRVPIHGIEFRLYVEGRTHTLSTGERTLEQGESVTVDMPKENVVIADRLSGAITGIR